MSRYVLTQEQLDRLQEQIQQLNRIYEAKQERLKELELQKTQPTDSKIAELLHTIEKLDNEVKDLKKTNKMLSEVNSGTKADYVAKIRQLEMLLDEERKLREYAEAFAREMELKCADEVMLKDLTNELCLLQRQEIEIGTQKIEELQRKLRSSQGSNPPEQVQVSSAKELKEIENTRSRGSDLRNSQLKGIIEGLRSQLSNLHEELGRKPARTEEDEARVKEMERLMDKIEFMMADINTVESMRKDLKYLKREIETRRRSSETEQQN